MFIVKKEIKGKEYYYLRKSIREDGKVKAKTIAYLGKTKEEAEEKLKQIQQKPEKPKQEKKPDNNKSKHVVFGYNFIPSDVSCSLLNQEVT